MKTEKELEIEHYSNKIYPPKNKKNFNSIVKNLWFIEQRSTNGNEFNILKDYCFNNFGTKVKAVILPFGILGEYDHNKNIIYLNRYLINKDELVYCLAHEIGHVEDFCKNKEKIKFFNDFYKNNFFTYNFKKEDGLKFYLTEVIAFNNARKLLKKLNINLNYKKIRDIRIDTYKCYAEKFLYIKRKKTVQKSFEEYFSKYINIYENFEIKKLEDQVFDILINANKNEIKKLNDEVIDFFVKNDVIKKEGK